MLEAVAAHARSAAGRDAVRASRPTTDRAEAERRLQVTADLIALDAEAGRLPTADVPVLGPALADAAPHGAALESRRGDPRRPRRRAPHGGHLRRDPERFPALAALADTLIDLRELRTTLARTLDDSGQIREDASPALAAARATCRELRAQLENRLLTVVRDPGHADVVSDQYVTVRNGRYVVPIRSHAAWSFGGVVQDRSGSDETVFIEPLFAVEMNNRLLLASKTEEAEERRVRVELTDLVRLEADALATLETARALADAHAAVAAFGLEHRATRLRSAPTTSCCAPRAIRCSSSRTGRSCRSTSCYARASAGSRSRARTPAARRSRSDARALGAARADGCFCARGRGRPTPCFSAVLADIGDAQSIERDLSTFTAHATNLAAIATAAGAGGLVLLDEPGAGTDPVEGAALAVGVLTDLLERGPRIAFTTHFAQVKTYALSEPALEIAACDVDAETGAARYELVYHSVGQSFAIPIARRHGVPARAIDVAERLLAGESQDLARAIARLEATRRELERARDDAGVERRQPAAARTEAEALAADLRARQRRHWTDDLEESRRFLRDVERKGRARSSRSSDSGPSPPRSGRSCADGGRDRDPRADAPEAAPATPPKLGNTVEGRERWHPRRAVEIQGERAASSGRTAVRGRAVPAPGRRRRTTAERVAIHVAKPAEADHERGEINLVGQRVRAEAIDALATSLDRSVRPGLRGADRARRRHRSAAPGGAGIPRREPVLREVPRGGDVARRGRCDDRGALVSAAAQFK